MPAPEVDSEPTAKANATSRAMLWVVFVLLFVFSYSEEIIGLLFDLAGFGKHNDWRTHVGWRLGLLAVEIVALAVVGLKKRSIERVDGDGPRLWRLWWSGAAVLIVVDAVLSELPFRPSVWLLVVAAVVIAAAMGVLMTTSLNADPRTLMSAARRAAQPTDWQRTRAVVPLMVGTFATYIAAIAYTRLIDTDTVRTLPADIAEQAAALPLAERLSVLQQVCENAISPVYFQHVVEVIPLLLLTLGLEFNYFRRNLRDPAHRVTTAATVALMSAALVFAMSTLPYDGVGCYDVLTDWHEYLAFVISVQGIFVGLATLVWLLVASTPDDG
ncbi:hypothetical protein [Mycobacterium sp. RTGN5]|uniref:hypothetical protein n=1 Tax=Mycobacterium sp. RTGN5 TaxID=3016522 RepID=UPI0029C81685|nr:hypothetical protein [Mycobacterium sp. RTGN5]